MMDHFFRTLIAGLLLSFMALVLANPAQAAWWWPFGDKGMDYRIDIEGVDEKVMEWFRHLQLTQKTKQRPPENPDELSQHAMTLEGRLNEALRAKGYYAAQIEQKLDLEAKPPILHYYISPGPRAHVSLIRLDWQGGMLSAPDMDKLRLKAGDPVDAEIIESDARQLQIAIGKDACLLSLEVTPILQLNADTHQAELIYRIEHGPAANFGDISIQGNQRTKERAIRSYLDWKQGECFDSSKVNKSQAELFETQLFSSVSITPAKQPDGLGEVPLQVELKERVPRTIRAGVNYATDQGIGVTLNWEHRNFSGGGEKFTADAVLAQQEQSLQLTERIPRFRRNDQMLALAGGVKHEDTKAYTSQAFNLSAGLERKISSHVNAGAGVAYDLVRTKDIRTGTQDYSLVSLPLFGEYDTRDDKQDARKGIFARAVMTPYQDMLSANLQFLKTHLIAQTYFSRETTYKPTLALRGSVGSIAGSPYSDLPADLRFYAGGGGSVRGYSYQSLSPYFNGKPVGGGSLVELSGELRLRFTETIGAVAFIDAGNAYSSSLPRIGKKLYYGAGLGGRYYSDFGPIRVDVGVPVNGGSVGQQGFALYVSLGQSF